ncbi:peptidylprolyl isomerase [Candidatus Peregrinibacteria bacterium]|nr:peptidylprolyl isomerase [Candidatus Peregrinibacteria bacterium]
MSSGDATIQTNKGTIIVDLYEDKAPETVKNFKELASQGKYDDVPFHRIIEDFMIQTGDFENQDGTGGHSYQGPGTTFEDEFHTDLNHQKYTLSMANRGPDTNGSQFFIVTAENGTPWLDGKHSVFGEVISGQKVVDQIGNAETDMLDRPQEEIKIVSVTVN